MSIKRKREKTFDLLEAAGTAAPGSGIKV